jgi:hypothetical protein
VSATDHFDNRQRSPEFEKAQARLIVTPFTTQLRAATAKEWTLLLTRKTDAAMALGSTVLMGLCLGFLFFQLPEEFNRAFDRTGVILMVTLLSAIGVFTVVPVMLGDREASCTRLHRVTSLGVQESLTIPERVTHLP